MTNLPHDISDAAVVAQFEGKITVACEKWINKNSEYFQLELQTEQGQATLKEWLLFTYAHAYAVGYNEAVGNLGRTLTKAYENADLKF